MAFTAGIDVAKRTSHVTVITADRKVLEDLKIPNDPQSFRRIFRKVKGDIAARCEASSNAFCHWGHDTESGGVLYCVPNGAHRKGCAGGVGSVLDNPKVFEEAAHALPR